MSQTETSLLLPRKRVITAGSLLGVAAVSTLIGSQFFTVGGIFVYSLVVLLHLSQTIATGLYGIFCAVALWGFIIVARLAFDAETDPANN